MAASFLVRPRGQSRSTSTRVPSVTAGGSYARFSLRAVPKTHAVICRSNRAPVMNSAASKVMIRDISVPPSWSTRRRR